MVKLSKDVEKVIESALEDAWDYVYRRMDGRVLIDYLNDMLPDGIRAETTRYGEHIFLVREGGPMDVEEIFFEWGRWDRWRAEVNYRWGDLEDEIERAVGEMKNPKEKDIREEVDRQVKKLIYDSIAFLFGGVIDLED